MPLKAGHFSVKTPGQVSLEINSQGVPQNYAEAVKWYRLAADQGDARAQFNLGFMYGTGQGVPQNYAEAGTCQQQ